MNILVGYDGSNVAKEALVLAKKHAKAFDGKVYLLNALAQGPDLQLEDIQKVEHELERLKISFEEDEIPCETHAVVSSLSAGETWFSSHRKTKLMRSSLVSEDGQRSGNCYSDQTRSISYFRLPARWSRLNKK